MWSGPRNISTAMMRAFGSRPDTTVTDEPLYEHYLKVTGIAHPGRDDVLAAHESDWRKVTETLIGPAPFGRNFVSGRAWTFADLGRVLASAVRFPSCIESMPMPGAIRPNCQYFTEARIQKLCGAGYDQRTKLIKDGVGRYMESYVATCDRNR